MFIGNAWEGALLRMKVGSSVAPLKIFLTQLEHLLVPGCNFSEFKENNA